MKKPASPYSAIVYTSVDPATDGLNAPGLPHLRQQMKVDNLKDRIPAPAHMSSLAAVRTSTERLHDPMPKIDGIEPMPKRGVKPKKIKAAGR